MHGANECDCSEFSPQKKGTSNGWYTDKRTANVILFGGAEEHWEFKKDESLKQKQTQIY